MKHPIPVHTIQNPVSLICLMRLYRVNTALRQMKRHGPVVRYGIYDIFHACVNRCLRRPHMRTDHRDLFRNIPEHRRHNLSVFLIGGIVGKFPEALIVQRLPYNFVEESALLR